MRFKSKFSIISAILFGSLGLASCSASDSQVNSGSSQPKPVASDTVDTNARYQWPVYVYNFGGLTKLSIEDQFNAVGSTGYGGLIVNFETLKKQPQVIAYKEAAKSRANLDVPAAFFRFRVEQDGPVDSSWQDAVDVSAEQGLDLWLITGTKDKSVTVAQAEASIRQVVARAEQKGVKVYLYPHSGAIFESVEPLKQIADNIGSDNVGVVMVLTHEIRFGNGDRIEQVIDTVQDKMGYVVLSGSDSFPSSANQSEFEFSTLKPLYRGDYDVSRVMRQLRTINYQGKVAYINHRFREKPEVYLAKSMETYQGWLKQLNEIPAGKHFDAPDQATWHAPSRTWFVSNLGGGISLAQDGYGWVSRLDENGKVIDPEFVGIKERMHAPSGMAITDDYLYVADRLGVHQIDIEKGERTAFYEIKAQEFVNDVVIKDGHLYVSDFFGNRIYRITIETGKVETWLETDKLKTPDGLYIDGNKLIIACWGVLAGPSTFDTTELGDVLSVDLTTKEISVVSPLAGNLEGVTKAGDYYYITDWASGELLQINAKTGERKVALSGLSHPTDPDFSKDLGVIAFPQHGVDQVLFYRPVLAN